MPIISYTDRRTPKGRLVVAFIYLSLLVGGLTMVYPFLIMVTGSVSNSYDYERRAPLPRYVWSESDRFMRMLCQYFPPAHRNSIRQLRSYFSDLPESWQIWAAVGDDTANSDKWAQQELARVQDPAARPFVEAAAKDYAEFAKTWDPHETILAYDQRYVTPFLRGKYQTLEALNKAWEVSIDDFAKIDASEWSGEPIDQAGYVPLVDTRYKDLIEFRQAYAQNRYSGYLKGEGAPAGFLRPAAMRYLWEDFVSEHGGDKLGDDAPRPLPFPVPANASPKLRALWLQYLKAGFQLRHVEVKVDSAREAAFHRFIIERFRNIGYFNAVMGGTEQEWTPIRSWGEIKLTPTVPSGPLAKVWMDFLRTEIPPEQWTIRDTLPEKAFQRFALGRHGSLAGVNQAYGLKLGSIEQLGIPFGEALLVTFHNRQWPITLSQTAASYIAVGDYLFTRGSAVRNTILLVLFTIVITLTVNPLCAYALSRFRLRQTERVIVFCLATMAFPAAVAAIPGFLLLRDIGFLNTFAALVLPGAANGMTIFLLKGFFDSLPKELYEAAAIDGAPEWMVFWRISIPLVKPILAVSLLNAFIAAYNGWEWAIIVCQDPKMWTIAVWTYQFYQTLTGQPFTVMAAFIVNSIPVLVVFLFCQKVILRGIILPQLK